MYYVVQIHKDWKQFRNTGLFKLFIKNVVIWEILVNSPLSDS